MLARPPRPLTRKTADLPIDTASEAGWPDERQYTVLSSSSPVCMGFKKLPNSALTLNSDDGV